MPCRFSRSNFIVQDWWDCQGLEPITSVKMFSITASPAFNEPKTSEDPEILVRIQACYPAMVELYKMDLVDSHTSTLAYHSRSLISVLPHPPNIENFSADYPTSKSPHVNTSLQCTPRNPVLHEFSMFCIAYMSPYTLSLSPCTRITRTLSLTPPDYCSMHCE